MIYRYSREALIKRIPTFVDRTDGIQLYDRDNLYPQRVEEIRNRSYTIKSAVSKLANFINGEGWTDQVLAKTVVNDKGQTMNDILDLVSLDAATYSCGFAIHLSVNMLGKYNGINVYPYKYFRYGLPDTDGDYYDIKYNTNWEKDPYKGIDSVKRIYTYPKFNPDPEEIKETVGQMGMHYPGQVLFFSPVDGVYPEATFDAVLDHGQTQSEIGVFQLSAIQNGFMAGHIVAYPGKFTDDNTRQKVKDSFGQFKGAANANSFMVLEETGEKKAEDLVAKLEMQNTDKMYEFTSKDVKNSIREAFSMPAEILGQLPESGMFNQQQMQDAYTYYNATTSDYRRTIGSVFKKIFSNWVTPVTEDFSIIPQKYQ
jgi:hypothetical protein